MSSEKDDFASPPSYTDSLRPQSASITSFPAPGQSLLDTITLTRATTIRSAIHTSILPLLSSRAAKGLPSTVLALLPSDIPLPPPPEKNEFSFVGYAGAERAEDAVKVISEDGGEEAVVAVRLSGEANTAAFWRLPAVVEEVERSLTGILNDRRGSAPAVVREVGEAKEKERRGFFGRGKKRGKVQEESDAAGSVEGGGDRVSVKVKVEEICLRMTNEFGLFDTMNRQCVIVRVDAGC
jgi:hypothetical protein